MCDAKTLFEQAYVECMERMIAGDSSPADEQKNLAQFVHMVPEDYTTEDFLHMLINRKKIKSSCIYLSWYRRLILDRQPLYIHMERPIGRQLVEQFFCGEWITTEEEQTEEFAARFQMMLDVVAFVREKEKNTDGIPPELMRVLEFDDVQLVAKAVRKGLLQKNHQKVCVDYCLEKNLLQAVPYLLGAWEGRMEYVYH
ncbi:MAG: hypothetical protein IJ327_03040 [Lachnospiraceae bacterium]|nr:hypothetical protein [Lachnospiraceae bacterium]